jgi:hypothetical protein
MVQVFWGTWGTLFDYQVFKSVSLFFPLLIFLSQQALWWNNTTASCERPEKKQFPPAARG